MVKKSKTSRPDETQRDKNTVKPDTAADLFPIVGIGASAGGLSAFTKLLKALPIDTGMAFILVQHLDPKHVSLLPDLMKRVSLLPVVEISDATRVEPNHIYVMPPNYGLALMHGVLHLMPRPDQPALRLPINDFFNSLAEDCQRKAVGVILSGTGSDGALGIQAIKAAGGITFAQCEESAEYNGMPHSAIDTGHVDFVLTPEEIARELTRIARHPYLRQELPNIEPQTPLKNDDINKIFALLRTHTGVDFTLYKLNTIQRRIRRRMLLHQLDRINDYVKFLQAHPKQLDALFKDMLINVTSFFREPGTLEALKDEIFPCIIKELSGNNQTMRIWIPACASGEEVYSVAIVLFELLGDCVNSTKIQLFASDIDKQAIDKARQGVYPPSIVENVGSERLQRFFIKTAVGYQVCQPIRDVCVFAVHDVTKDPPFSRLDFISCRNLLIYFNATLQSKVLRTFFYALQPNRFLMLGASETIGREHELFSLIDKKNKIYRRKSLTIQANFDFPATAYTLPAFSESHFAAKHIAPGAEVLKLAENLILGKYSPPGVIIDQNLRILHFHGQTGPYIQPSAGIASFNLLKMVRQELLPECRSAAHQAIKEHCSVRKEGIRIAFNGNIRHVNLQILPLSESNNTLTQNYLVLFEPGIEAPVQKTSVNPETNSKNAKDLRIKELENELITEREYLQSIIEELEGANEDLQSTNEEVQSINEEFQSTNEELETSKEELQSTNEELATIIEEHANRNQALNTINNDMNNLLANIDLAIVMLDKDLRIRHFTSAAKPLMNLIDADIGRPIGNLQPNVDIANLEKEIQQVIRAIAPQSLEVQDRNGHWHLLRLRPYKTLDGRIDGAVMVFIDIDHIKKTEQLQRMLAREQRLAAVVRDSNDAVTVQDFAGHILAWNKRATAMYGYSEEEALQLDAATLIPEKAREDMRMLRERLRHGEKTPPCESWRFTKDGRLIKVWLTVSLLLSDAGSPSAMAITEREIT